MLEHNGLEYETRGDGDAVLLIHGSHIAGSFLPFMEEPALEGYRLIRYHRRGFAGSAPVPIVFAIPDQARDARSLLDHLGADRAHVVGHSYGGATALQLALDAPQAVRSLVLLEPALLSVPSGAEVREGIAQAARVYESGDPAGAVDQFLTLVTGADWRSTTEALVPGGPAQAERDAATFFETEVPALDKWSFDAERAERISQPVLYVIGEQSGAVFEEGVELLRSLVPQTREARVPGVDHRLQMQNPALVAEKIAEFLRGLPS